MRSRPASARGSGCRTRCSTGTGCRLFPMFIVFFISALAETNRPPFDLPEAEIGAGGGFHGRIFLHALPAVHAGRVRGDRHHVRADHHPVPGRLAAAAVDLRRSPGCRADLVRCSSCVFVFFMFAMVKAFVPRYRYDQLMRLGLEGVPAAVAVHGGGGRRRAAVLRTRALRGSPMAGVGQAVSSLFLKEFVSALFLSLRYFFTPKKRRCNYPFEKGPLSPALPRRACAAPLSQRRGALHRLQAVRGDLPGAGDHHRGGPAPQRRHAPHHPLRHRHGEVHLLRPVPGGLPGRCHRRGPELRVRHRDARGALLRQGAPARERRPLGARDRQSLALDAPLSVRRR